MNKLQQENYKEISFKFLFDSDYNYFGQCSSSTHSISFSLHKITIITSKRSQLSPTLPQDLHPSRYPDVKKRQRQVTPCIGLLLSQQSIKIEIVTRLPNTPQLVHDISYQNKFLVEYALLTRIPSTVQEGLRMITEENKQKQKLFVATEYRTDATPENYSGISNKYSYRSTFNDNRSQQRSVNRNRFQNYKITNEQQKLQHLNNQLDRLEIQKAHIITSSKPNAKVNLIRLLIVFVVCILTGYFAGKSLFGHAKKVKKQKEYRWFGLEKYLHHQEQEPQEWWIFWK